MRLTGSLIKLEAYLSVLSALGSVMPIGIQVRGGPVSGNFGQRHVREFPVRIADVDVYFSIDRAAYFCGLRFGAVTRVLALAE
jgi:hypothetical protein